MRFSLPLALCALAAVAADRPRLVVTTDVGGDPDDRQSLVRLLHYADEFDLEALVASAAGTPGELKDDVTRPDLIREVVAAYGRVRPNLLTHRPGYPPAEELLARVHAGNPHRGVGRLGDGHDTAGSRAVLAALDRDDPRPVNVAVWGGSTDLAQALWRVRAGRGPDGVRRALAKPRVFSVGHQDDTGPWLVREFPGLFHVVAKAPDGRDKREAAYRGMYLGGDVSLTSRAWIDEHVRRGPLGSLYPVKTWTAPNPHGALKEGDTPSWFFFLPNGLGDPARPESGGWGGRYTRSGTGPFRDAADTVNGVTDARAAVWRWRPAFQADFAARAAWAVKPPAEANHPPAAVLGGDRSRAVLTVEADAGEDVPLSAQGSCDPDGDALSYRWWVYREAGTFAGDVPLSARGAAARLTVPAEAAGKTVHVVLEVTDAGTPPLTAYRRAVVSVRERTPK